MEEIQAELNINERAVCTFLDIAWAFDNTSHQTIQQALGRRGVDLSLKVDRDMLSTSWTGD